jgi:sugar lactone lactonase YvrE
MSADSIQLLKFSRPLLACLTMSAVCVSLISSVANSQAPRGGYSAPAEHAEVTPINNELPNPYKSQTHFGVLPEGRIWGSVTAMDIDVDGEHLWVAVRCETNSCAGSDVDPVLLLNPEGEIVRSFGSGLLLWPHGMDVDAEGNVWVTDARSATPAELERFPDAAGKGHRVIKFSPNGEVLMVLGVAGEPGMPPTHLNEPSDVLVAPDGSIFVAEAHTAQFLDEPTPTAFGRISKFSADGTFVKSWGTFGWENGEFRTPHALAMDSTGRLFVADRGNRRIQIFDQDGDHLDTWYQFSRISGLHIDDNDVLYAIDSESGENYNPGWRKGLRIGSAVTGEVWYFVPEHFLNETVGLGGFGAMGEGVTVAENGVVYAGEIGPPALRGITKFTPVLMPIESRTER